MRASTLEHMHLVAGIRHDSSMFYDLRMLQRFRKRRIETYFFTSKFAQLIFTDETDRPVAPVKS